MVLTSARFESRCLWPPLATDQPWTTQRDFHLARRKPFDPSGVALLCKAGTQHADFIWVLGDTSSALGADLWVLLYCLRGFNLLVNQTGPFLMFLMPTVLTITQQHLCCCITLMFVLLHLWSWALQIRRDQPLPATWPRLETEWAQRRPQLTALLVALTLKQHFPPPFMSAACKVFWSYGPEWHGRWNEIPSFLDVTQYTESLPRSPLNISSRIQSQLCPFSSTFLTLLYRCIDFVWLSWMLMCSVRTNSWQTLVTLCLPPCLAGNAMDF